MNNGRMGNFEKTRIMSARALQIIMGAPVLVKVPKGTTRPLDIVKLEFEKGVLPISVVRKMPSGEEVLLDVNGNLIN